MGIIYFKLYIIINIYEMHIVAGKHDNLNNNKHSSKIIYSSRKNSVGGVINQVYGENKS